MAIQKKEIKKQTKEAPLTKEQFDIISDTEKYVDDEIEKTFKREGEHASISIELGYFQFDYNAKGEQLKLSYTTRMKMYRELEARFKKAGWKIRVEYDDGLDGPNMSGPDYVILS